MRMIFSILLTPVVFGLLSPYETGSSEGIEMHNNNKEDCPSTELAAAALDSGFDDLKNSRTGRLNACADVFSADCSAEAAFDDASFISLNATTATKGVTLNLGGTNYRYVKKLGVGGFADVYLCESLKSGAQIAVKVDRNPKSTAGELALQKQASSLGSPYVLKIEPCDGDCAAKVNFDENEQAGKTLQNAVSKKYVFTPLQYAAGGDLFHYIYDVDSAGRMDGIPKRQVTAEMVMQIALGIHDMHRANIVHRDFKPENVLFLDKERTRLVIADFGLSSRLDRDMLCADRKMCGTQLYVSPTISNHYRGVELDWYSFVKLFVADMKLTETDVGGQTTLSRHKFLMAFQRRFALSLYTFCGDIVAMVHKLGSKVNKSMRSRAQAKVELAKFTVRLYNSEFWDNVKEYDEQHADLRPRVNSTASAETLVSEKQQAEEQLAALHAKLDATIAAAKVPKAEPEAEPEPDFEAADALSAAHGTPRAAPPATPRAAPPATPRVASWSATPRTGRVAELRKKYGN